MITQMLIILLAGFTLGAILLVLGIANKSKKAWIGGLILIIAALSVWAADKIIQS